MVGEQTLFPGLKLWLVLILVIATFNNPKQAAAISEHAGRKLATEIPGYISIDCGATEDYTDRNIGILYESDTKYIDTGTINEISPDFTSEDNVFSYNYPQQIKKLRSFPNGTRNCYTLRPQQGKNNNYLIRAILVYGNYDGKNQTPVFDLYLGVNKWVTVKVAQEIYEIIHVPLRDYIEVCLVKSGDGVPYISALELRPLDNSAYQIKAGALSKLERNDVGADKITRYPVDVYDRLWSFLNFVDLIPISTSSTIYNHSNDDAYKLPAEVLMTASQTQNASIPISLYYTPPDGYSQCYMYLHFAEVQKLENGQQRELRIDLNGQRNVTESLRLEYLKPLIIAPNPNDPPVSGSPVHFSIYAAEGSDLPPILNAFEVYVIIELPLSPTNLNDVNAIMDIKQIYRVTRNWQGDPCLPSDFLWDGLNCSSNSTPRIISLNLSSSKLTGEVASSLSKLEEIQSLDLSYNNLTGPLPEFLAQLPNLRILNLIGNKLKGPIPAALMQKSNDRTLQLSVDENLHPCLSTPCPKKKEKKFVIPVVASVIAVLVIVFTLSVLAIYKRKRRGVILNSKKEDSLKSKNRPFTYSEIVRITDNFRTVIGEGGFGKVYFGTLNEDTEVAVKMLSPGSKQGYKEFRAEVQLLMIIHHRNLVSLIGYCDDHENMALIYEYMANGNLKQHLSETNPNILSWNERLQIAVDAAHGLEYLHNGCRPPIIHRDLKSSNILLNENMQAKISDFGLSRAFNTESDSHISTDPKGTYGYLDPDPKYHTLSILNKKSDVYSFGVILLELITGLPAIIKEGSDDTHISWRISPVVKTDDIENIVDQKLHGTYNTHSASKAIDIAMECILPTAIQRPDISKVYEELKECLKIETAPEGNFQRTESSVTVSNNSTEMTYEYGQTDQILHTW